MRNIGKVKKYIKNKLKISTEIEVIKVNDVSFKKHLIKRNHENMFEYYDEIENIINEPDYFGVNPREKGTSLEYVKRFEDNILIGIKLDVKKDYFYIATMHEISNLKLEQRIKNGRLRPFDK